MVSLITLVIIIISVLIGKVLFSRWLNHISIYAITWGIIIILQQAHLLPYVRMTNESWILIAAAFLSFSLGIITFLLMRDAINQPALNSRFELNNTAIFSDGGKVLYIITLIIALIAFAGAIQNWMVLIKMYGSIPGVLLNANEIYSLRVAGKIKGVIPYISSFGFAAIFLSALYTSYKNRLNLIIIISFSAIIIREIANVGRAGMLIALIIFCLTYLYTRPENTHRKEYGNKPKSNKKLRTVISILLVFTIFAVSAYFVKAIRGTVEHYAGASKKLRALNTTEIITPSIYLYFSSHIVVFSKYLENDNEAAMIGENTFLPIYSILSKIGVVERPSNYQRGYHIPMWTNTGTFLRELHADFGAAGIFLVPFILGLLITYFWLKFYKYGNLLTLVLLVYFTLIIAFSFLLMVTRFGLWYISLVILLLSIKAIEKIITFKYN